MKKNYFSSKISRGVKSSDFNQLITRNFRSLVGSMLLVGLPASLAYGQTNPTPQPMPYTAGHFDSLTGNSPYNYPAGWQGWKLEGAITDTYTSVATDDVSFTKGGNNYTIAGITDMVGKLGLFSTTSTRTAPVLAVNAIDYQQIKVKYDINVQRKTSNRVMGIQLQYRIGTEGAFTPIVSSTEVFDGANLAQNNTGTDPLAGATVTKTIDLPSDAYHQNILQFRWVVARLQGGSGDNIGFSIDNVEVTGITNPCANNALPYREDFTGLTATQLPDCSVVEDVDSSGNKWAVNTGTTAGFTPPILRYAFHRTIAANDWFFTKGLALEAGVNYRLRYRIGTGNYDEKLKISIGNIPSSGSMNQTIVDYGAFRKTTPGIEDQFFTVPNNGNYHIGFYAYSDINKLNINIDDIRVEVAPTCLEPTAVTTSEVTARTANVSWTASVSNPSQYEYYLATDAVAPTSATEATGNTSGTTLALSTLTPESDYKIWVRSICSATDVSEWSEVSSFRTLISCPAPTELTSSTITTNSAVIGWTSTSTQFEYVVSTTNTAPETSVVGTLVNGNTATVTGLNDTTTYYWWVRAVCDTDDKSAWTSASFQTNQVPAPFPFTDNFDNQRWVFANGTQRNKFFIGTPQADDDVTYADNKLFVSSDGLTNSYITNASSVYVYRDVTLPADLTFAKISFDWILKGEGGASTTSTPYDYGRFYIVPTSVTPAAGTNLGHAETITDAIYSLRNNPVATATGRRHYLLYNPSHTYTGAYEDIAHNYVDEAVDLTEYAGQTVRLVFFFKNDSGIHPPSLAIDNFELVNAPSCLTLTDLNTTNITFNEATLNWTGNSESYQYYVSTTNTAPTANEGTNTTQNTITSSDLEPSTRYYWWVKAECDTTNTWVAGPTFVTKAMTASFPFTDDFETLKWNFVGEDQVNQFHVNTPQTSGNITFDNGKLFISNNGTNAEYANNSSHSYTYKDVVLPADLTIAKIAFKWLGGGENGPWDYGRFYITTPDETPIAGQEINRTAQNVPGAIFNAVNSTRTTNTYAFYKGAAYTAGTFAESAHSYLKEDLDLSEYAGQTVRLVFYWRNDTGTSTPPSLVVDDFELTYAPNCLSVTNTATANVTTNSATISWNGNSDVYTYYVSTTPEAPATGSEVSASEMNLTSLEASTTYYWWVKANCDTTNTLVAGGNFTTLALPHSYPFNDTFDTLKWTLTNGEQYNKFYVGTPTESAVAFENNVLFVSENGTANTYDSGETSRIFAYADVVLPTDITTAQIKFNWNASGESTYDYGRFFIVPTTYMPVAGTNITPTGTIANQIFGSAKLNLTGNTVTEFDASTDLTSYAGQTVRLLFYWKNDASGGTQAPLSIDNFCFDNNCASLSTTNVAQGNFIYYPNPVQNELNFKGEQIIANIEVYNLTGQVVNQTKVGAKTYQLNTSKLSSGVYMVKVSFDNGTTKTVKIIKK